MYGSFGEDLAVGEPTLSGKYVCDISLRSLNLLEVSISADELKMDGWKFGKPQEQQTHDTLELTSERYTVVDICIHLACSQSSHRSHWTASCPSLTDFLHIWHGSLTILGPGFVSRSPPWSSKSNMHSVEPLDALNLFRLVDLLKKVTIGWWLTLSSDWVIPLFPVALDLGSDVIWPWVSVTYRM